jgi:hypothetical protein
LGVPLHAQLTRGFISGTVQDATGAVMPSVKIVITKQGAEGAIPEPFKIGASTPYDLTRRAI